MITRSISIGDREARDRRVTTQPMMIVMAQQIIRTDTGCTSADDTSEVNATVVGGGGAAGSFGFVIPAITLPPPIPPPEPTPDVVIPPPTPIYHHL